MYDYIDFSRAAYKKQAGTTVPASLSNQVYISLGALLYYFEAVDADPFHIASTAFSKALLIDVIYS